VIFLSAETGTKSEELSISIELVVNVQELEDFF
jgi:hypothetical protein